MDWISWISVLVTLMHVPAYKASKELDFDIWEGNVTVLWDPPEGAPIDPLYQVKQTTYYGYNWEIVPECNMTTETRCELGSFLFKPETKIKVELHGNGNFSWSAVKRIRLLDSKLLAPEFDLSSTTNMVKVKIHRKPFLKELFKSGPRYSAILYPKGQESQAITVSDDDDDEDGEVEFTSLPLWQEYCVQVKVEMISNDVSNTSLPRCIYPSADMSMVIYMAVIGVVGVLTFFMFVVCFFLRRPGKMPAVLKSAVNGWHPMHVGLIQVETVTDKGWVVNTMAEKSKAFYEDEELSEDDKERRESTDSGVSVGQQNSLKNRGTEGHTADEDSGCGSLTGTEDSGLSGGRRSLDELPFLDGGENSSNGKRKDDSGLGMVNKDDSDNLQGADGDLSEVVVGGDGYRSQSPSADAESKATVPYDLDTKMASPSSGYRSGHVTCSCSNFETCIWCKTRKLLTDSGSLSHEKLDTTDNHNDRPSYLRKSPVLGLGDLSSQSDENSSESSLFITCPLLLQEPCQLDTLPLTLGDVELTFT